MKPVTKAIIVAAAALWFCADLTNGKADAGAPPAKIVVGTMRVPPFVLRSDDGNWSGLSIELWNQIAADLDMKFEFREYDYDLAGLLDAVERSQIDAAIAAIPITYENEARFERPISPRASASPYIQSRNPACWPHWRASSVVRHLWRSVGWPCFFSSLVC
jgi:ABC-type amino acid transport substrate-binding protein